MAKRNIILIFGLFLIALIFFFIFQHIDLRGDARQYYNIAQNLIKGNGYSISPVPPYRTALHIREPLYPLIIALGLLLFNNIYSIVFIQILMQALTAYLIYRIAVDFMKQEYALLVFGLTFLFPTLINYAFLILTETTFVFFQVLSVYLLYFGLKRENLYIVLLSGITCWMSFLTRQVVVLFPLFFAVLGAGLFFLKRPSAAYKFVKHTMIFLLFFLVLVFSWNIYMNNIYEGRHNKDSELGKRGMFQLAVRSELVNLSNKDILVYGLSVFSEKLVNKFFPEYGKGVLTTREGFFYKNTYKKYELQYINRNPLELAYATFKNHPFKFMVTGFIELIDLNMFFHLPYFNSNERFQNNALVSLLRGFLKMIGLFMLFFSIRGMSRAVKAGYLLSLFPLISLILYYNAIFIFIDAIPRYSMPLIPFYLLFLVIGIAGGSVFKPA